MKVLKFAPGERDLWLFTRRGKITGSRLSSVVSTGGPTKEAICKELESVGVEFKKTDKKEDLEKLLTPQARARLLAQGPKKRAFYALIAERLGVPPDGENQMERGARLEKEAIERFAQETGKEVDGSLILWTRDDNDSIAVSPDGVVSEEEAVEAKCLSSELHIEAYLTKKIPDEYWLQAIEYFVVNDQLQTLHFVFYDPRFVMFVDPATQKARLDYFEIEIRRDEVQNEVDEYLEYERRTIEEVNDIVNQLTF